MTSQVKRSTKKVPKSPKSICPECNITYNDCGCSFMCPACGTRGQYLDNHILCPNDSCRVVRFFTQ